MALNYERLVNLHRELEQTYSWRDTILYALGVGAGIDVDTPEKLNYVFEPRLKALPTMAVALAAPGFWQREPEFGIEWQKVLHGEQSVIFHKPLPIEGKVHALMVMDAVYDKGAGKGALAYSKRELFDSANGDLLATIRQNSFLRANGGEGGLTEGAPKPHPVPTDRPSDNSIALTTRAEQAMIYRLGGGDYNPLHIDPAAAALSGFPRPILHGLGTYGIVGRAVIAAECGGDGDRLRRLDVRFTSPVFPGETIVTEFWREAPGKVAFRTKVAERDIVVIDNGYAEHD